MRPSAKLCARRQLTLHTYWTAVGSDGLSVGAEMKGRENAGELNCHVRLSLRKNRSKSISRKAKLTPGAAAVDPRTNLFVMARTRGRPSRRSNSRPTRARKHSFANARGRRMHPFATAPTRVSMIAKPDLNCQRSIAMARLRPNRPGGANCCPDPCARAEWAEARRSPR